MTFNRTSNKNVVEYVRNNSTCSCYLSALWVHQIDGTQTDMCSNLYSNNSDHHESSVNTGLFQHSLSHANGGHSPRLPHRPHELPCLVLALLGKLEAMSSALFKNSRSLDSMRSVAKLNQL